MSPFYFIRGFWIAAALSCLSACTCAREADINRGPSGGAASVRQATTDEAVTLRSAQVSTLFESKASAYRSALAVDGAVVTVVTEDAIHRIVPDAPAQTRQMKVGSNPTFTRASVIFWRKGQLVAVPKGAGEERILGLIEHSPRQVVAAEDRYAWLAHDARLGSSISTFKKGKEAILYRTKQTLSAAVMLHDWVFFVESVSPGHFKIGGVPLSGRKPAFTPIKQGRTPSMLGVGEQLYYFDLMQRALIRITPDLVHESVVARDLVCSPFAVADQIYCSRVEGLFALPLDGGTPTVLTHQPYGLVARVAASPEMLAWINETGDEHLTVRAIRQHDVAR